MRAIILSLFFAITGVLAQAETLTLGSVNDNVRKHLDRFAPLAAYLERELADHGITEVAISVLPTSQDMVEALSTDRVDLFFDSPLVAARVAREAGAEPFLRRWKRGVGSYHSLIIVPTDSPLQSIEDLVGRRIGFQDPDSTSGFLLPLDMVLQAGLDVIELPDREADFSSNSLGYVFTQDDKNTVLWLAKGWIDAAATDPRGFAMLENARPGQYRALAQSMEVPRQVVIARKGLSPELAEIIKQKLIALKDSDEGKKIMKKFHKTTRFDEFPDGVEATFAPIYALLSRLEVLRPY